MNPLQLLINPLRPALAEGPAVETHILLRAQAPLPPVAQERKRPSLHLAIVLDRSGSMGGGPLEEAKACAQAIIRKLEPQDRVAVVVYDDTAQVLVPCQSVQDPERLCRAIAPVQTGGSTNLHDGWALGVGELRKALDRESVSQVLVLSDGQANAGICAPEELASAAAKARAIGIGTSTYGLGDGFEERLMTTMAAQGQGRAYYGEHAEDLLGVFLEEFQLLSDLCAPDVRLEIEAEPGVELQVLNPYPMVGVTGWILPALPFGGEAWALARVKAGPAALNVRDAEGAVRLFRAGLAWKAADGTHHSLPLTPVALPLLPPEQVEAMPQDPMAALRLRDLRIGDLQERIHEKALEGDWKEVHRLLDELRKLAGEDPTLQALVENLADMAKTRSEARLAKEAHYGRTARLMSSGASEQFEALMMTCPDAVPEYYRPKTSFGKRKRKGEGPKV